MQTDQKDLSVAKKGLAAAKKDLCVAKKGLSVAKKDLSTVGWRLSMDNRGLSLVEIIIVVAIMSVLTGVLALGVSAALSKPADECAEKIVSTLNSARITTMGKQEISMKFYQDDTGVYLVESITDTSGSYNKKSKIGQKGVMVSYKLEGDTDYRELNDSGIILSFKRSTGGFNNVFTSGPSGNADTGKHCVEVKVHKASRDKIIKLAYLTGKVMIE
ncbi:MAG: type II secretion system GspH family protein [Bacteroidales bacterium]|nr:type II secretion system GspH family protein [Lachnoclostridium sp.]MCM1385059.1 type II secretion system GspH family protein [Lachnoclostridium sp.]MCM1465309.1 type II secretion system GspH family protein [Bacteroidales bacterium]